MSKKKPALKTESLTTLMKIRQPWKRCSKKFMMKEGADLGSRDESGRTALHRAIMHGHLNVVEALLEKGSVHGMDKYGYRPVHFAAVPNSMDMMHLLLNRGADPTITTNSRQTALHHAAYLGNCHVIHALLGQREIYARRSLLEAVDCWEATALHYAAGEGHLAATKLLLDYGANLDASDMICQTALHRSAQKNYARVVEALLLKGADFTSKDENNMTPEEVAPSGSVCQQLLSGHEQHYPSLQRLCRMNIHAALGEIREKDVQAMSWLAPPLQRFLLFKNAL